MNTKLKNPSYYSDVYQKDLPELAAAIDMKSHCLHCGWSAQVDLQEIDYENLEALKDRMLCGNCFTTGLSLSALPKLVK